MGTIASPHSLSYYFRKGHFFTDLTKKIFSGGYYHSNAAYYNAVLGQYANFSNYIGVFNESMKLSTLHTEIIIQPGILGANSKSVISQHGKPDLIFTDKNLSIYVYKWKFNGLRTRCEVHLYKGQAFMVNYIYNQLDKSERNYIIKSVTGKYFNKYVNEIDFAHSKISDRNSNTLIMDDYMMGLKITYLSNCESDWYEAMIGEVNDRKARQDARVRVIEKRFMNKI